MPGPSSNPALTADLGRNLRDHHPEIFAPRRRAPVTVPNRVAHAPLASPMPDPRRSLLGRLMSAALGFALRP